MHLRSLQLLQFKNHGDLYFEFPQGAVCFAGPNGSGKTNILDAIHYLCLSKSYFNASDAIHIQHSQEWFSVRGIFSLDEIPEEIVVSVRAGSQKSIRRNGKDYPRLSDHVGIFPLVIVAPVDQDLITGGSEERRKFMDSIICQNDRLYLEDRIAYNRVLQQRNSLLKQYGRGIHPDIAVFEFLDNQMVELGERIYRKRLDFIHAFHGVYRSYYAFLTSEEESVEITYESDLDNGDFSSILQEQFSRDQILQYTSKGIHKDDLLLTIDGYPVKRFGSQGQQKSVTVALKLAQFEILRLQRGIKPILLLDDIFDKLDDFRVGRLMELVSKDTFGQIFITDTHAERVEAIFNALNISIQVFRINGKSGILKLP